MSAAPYMLGEVPAYAAGNTVQVWISGDRVVLHCMRGDQQAEPAQAFGRNEAPGVAEALRGLASLLDGVPA